MRIQPCPECQSLTVQWLERVSGDAQVNYYRCERGHVWALPKDQLDSAPTVITRNAQDNTTAAPGAPSPSRA